MKVWVIVEMDNDCPIGADGDESYYEWETIVKVVDSIEKAEAYCKGKSFHSFRGYDVE